MACEFPISRVMCARADQNLGILCRVDPFEVRLARDAEDVQRAQALRYEVFVRELGGDGPLVNHDARIEQDRFDPFCDHLLLINTQSDQVVGTYRVMRPEQAERAGGYYTQTEYDLGPVLCTNHNLLELGRSCLHPCVRGGAGMHLLWTGLAAYIAHYRVDLLFGVASFHGTDTQALAAPLSLLHHRHLAPKPYRLRARAEGHQRMDLIAQDALDRKTAMQQIPSLMKGYLRLGGYVGEGAFVDHEFCTTDVCLILDIAQINDRQRKLYIRGVS